jgi:hypothetical protein
MEIGRVLVSGGKKLGASQHLHGGDEDAESLREQGDGRVEFDFHSQECGVF